MEIDKSIRTCSHCDTQGYFVIISDISQVEEYEDKGVFWDYGRLYKLLRCPNCDGLTLLKGSYHSGMDDYPEYSQEYPQNHGIAVGIPAEIAKELQVLGKLRRLDYKSHLVCCRRILEKVCRDLGATKDKLFDMVNELEKNGKFTDPIKLLANSLRKMGNIGAHDSAKKVDEVDLGKVERSLFIVLDYFYVGPHLSSDLNSRFD